MTNVSKNILDQETEKKLRNQFAKFFSDQSTNEIEALFYNLLTASEQTMFIKRLAVIVMLIEGESTYSIPKTLQMSDSTVRDIKSNLTLGKYDYLIERYHNKTFNAKAFLQILETLLNAGMPSLGKDRWKSLR
jgi:uncharacterized protein YerC